MGPADQLRASDGTGKPVFRLPKDVVTMVCMQRELSRPPTFFNHVPDACLFGLGGLVFVKAWLWPGTVIFPTVLRWMGAAVISVALMLITATMSALRRARTSTNPIDAPSRLLISGPFSWSRNPLYVAYVVTLCGCALASGSWLALGCPLLGFVVINGLIIPIEELRMTEEFGDAYRRYCRQMRRWL